MGTPETITTLLRGLGTLDQYAVMQTADRLLAERCGRYYGGPLADVEVVSLLPASRT